MKRLSSFRRIRDLDRRHDSPRMSMGAEPFSSRLHQRRFGETGWWPVKCCSGSIFVEVQRFAFANKRQPASLRRPRPAFHPGPLINLGSHQTSGPIVARKDKAAALMSDR